MVSNGCADPIREQFFNLLSEKKPIASGGKFKNNIGRPVEDKLEFLQSYKFNIAFENCSSRGYCSEKLIEALGAQTVPIYWGDPTAGQIINPKSFINMHDFPSLEAAIAHILKVDADPQLYLQMLQERAFLIEDAKAYYEKQLQQFFHNIFSQNYHQAIRRMFIPNYWHIRRISVYFPFHKVLLMKMQGKIRALATKLLSKKMRKHIKVLLANFLRKR